MSASLKKAGKSTAAILKRLIGPMVGRNDLADALGYIENAGAPSSVAPDFIGQLLFDTTNLDFYRAFGTSAGNWALAGPDTLSLAELTFLDGAVAGTPTASKAVVADTNANLGAVKATSLAVGTSGSETTIGATANEINMACDESANSLILTSAGLVLTASDSGKTYFINNATGFIAATLPSPVIGMRFRFINMLANTSGNHTVVTGSSANIIKGNQNSVAGDAGDFGTADDTISWVANQSIAGDKVELYTDGTSWFAYAISKVAAGVTFTQAS